MAAQRLSVRQVGRPTAKETLHGSDDWRGSATALECGCVEIQGRGGLYRTNPLMYLDHDDAKPQRGVPPMSPTYSNSGFPELQCCRDAPVLLALPPKNRCTIGGRRTGVKNPGISMTVTLRSEALQGVGRDQHPVPSCFFGEARGDLAGGLYRTNPPCMLPSQRFGTRNGRSLERCCTSQPHLTDAQLNARGALAATQGKQRGQ